MAVENRFQYRPLASESEIRLLSVDHVSDAGRFFCTMVHVDRHNLPPNVEYMAVSYRWGDETVLCSMEIKLSEDVTDRSGTHESESYRARTLPRSTMDMLHDLHKNERITDRWFWIDCICLNQADTIEKGHQVKRMGQIFELASLVLVYAGPELPSTRLAMTFWKTLGTAFDELPLDSNGERERIPTKTLLRMTNTTESSDEWKALAEHLSRPWFGRVWVIQEVVLPKDVVFVWGPYSLSWPHVAEFTDWVFASSILDIWGQYRSLDVTWEVTIFLSSLRALRVNREQQGGRCSLHDLEDICSISESSDPRDRIYGILGLLYGDGTNLAIIPDYGPKITARDVYTDAARKCLLIDDDFEIMENAGIGRERDIADLPSWVPDFSKDLGQCSERHMKAGKGDLGRYIKPFEFDRDDFILQAFLVCSIETVLDYASAPSVLQDGGNAYMRWYLEAAIELVKAAHPAPWTNETFETFWRTLTYNTGDYADEPSPEYYGSICEGLEVVKKSGVRVDGAIRALTSVQKQQFLDAIYGRGYKRAVCMTSTKLPGLLPLDTRRGDILAVCPRARVPFVLRPTGDLSAGRKVFRLVGTGYVHELNDGIHVAAFKGVLEDIVLR